MIVFDSVLNFNVNLTEALALVYDPDHKEFLCLSAASEVVGSKGKALVIDYQGSGCGFIRNDPEIIEFV